MVRNREIDTIFIYENINSDKLPKTERQFPAVLADVEIWKWLGSNLQFDGAMSLHLKLCLITSHGMAEGLVQASHAKRDTDKAGDRCEGLESNKLALRLRWGCHTPLNWQRKMLIKCSST